MSGIS
jgi:hypothetical protein